MRRAGITLTVHRGGGAHAGVDQGLGAFLALDQHHLRGADHSRLVVQRARIGRCHLVPLSVPGAELFLVTGRVVAIHDRDQFARGVEVVPFGGGWAEFIDRR